MFSKILLAATILSASLGCAEAKESRRTENTICGAGQKSCPNNPSVCCANNQACCSNGTCAASPSACQSPVDVKIHNLKVFESDGKYLVPPGKYKCQTGEATLHLNDNSFECEKPDKATEKKK